MFYVSMMEDSEVNVRESAVARMMIWFDKTLTPENIQTIVKEADDKISKAKADEAHMRELIQQYTHNV